MGLFFCFILLVIQLALAQNQLPYNQSVFQEGADVFVSPCGVAVVSFRVSTPLPRYFFTMTITAVSPVNFNMAISLKAPNGPFLDYTQCQPLKLCTTAAGSCSVIEGCGDQDQQWYAYVETQGTVQGQFQLSLKVTAYPNQTFVTIDNDNNVGNFTRFGGSPVGAGGSSLSQYDYYTFTLGSRPPGTIMDFEVKPESGTMNFVLYRSSANANPFAGCVTPPLNRTRLEPCEVSQGGTWSLAIERTQDNQFYLLRLWYTNAINFQLNENVPVHTQLRKAGDFVYFRYNVPSFSGVDLSTTQKQIYFILDNVVGGVVQIQSIFNQPPGSVCSGGATCQSIEGCHLTVENCVAIPSGSGFYTIIAKAITVFQPYIDVSFQVRGYTNTINTVSLVAGSKVRNSLKLSEYAQYRFTRNNTVNTGDWVDIEFYVDRDLLDDVPATLFVGTTPFPINNTFRGCPGGFYKKCDTTIWIGSQRWCFLQLDPCELEEFTNGIYVNVFAHNQINRVSLNQEHTYLQNPFDFTIYTTVRNPNNFRINHGTVITDEVIENWKKAYRIDDVIKNGRLEIAISANYHYVFDTGNALVTDNDTSRVELDIDIVYAQAPYIGPRCLSCYRVQQSRSVSLTALQTTKFEIEKCVNDHAGLKEHIYLVITGNNTRSLINRTVFNFTDNRFVITAKNVVVSPVETIKPTQFSNIISTEKAFGGLQYWILIFDTNLLRTNTLALKLRAHPRSGRQMCLFIADSFDPACADPNISPKCGSSFPSLSYCCNVNNTNKGFCYINIQLCDLIPQIGRTFYVEVRSLIGFQNLTTPNVNVEFAYSFTYDLVPHIPQPIALSRNRGLDTNVIVDLEAELYQHFSVDIPPASVGQDTFIIEAYFDSNNLYATFKPINLYLNPPSQATLAGLPSHSAQCLCFTRTERDLNKVVMIIDRCELEQGRYYFSVYTESFGFQEGKSHVTIKAYVTPYVQPITFEDPHDLSLFFGEPAAYRINFARNEFSDNGRTDKELQVWIWSNIAQYNASIQYRLANNIGTCGCGGTLNDVQYSCGAIEDSRNTQVGRCDVITGACNLQLGLNDPVFWYIITQVTEPDPLSPVDRHQVVPFTLTATKLNSVTTVRPLLLAPSTDLCDYTSRIRNMQNWTIPTEEYVFFNVQNQNPNGFTVYVDNITDGTLTIFAGNNLPTRNCTLVSVECPETPNGGGPPCIVPFSGCTSVNYIGIKVVSNDENKDVRFQISSCIRNLTAIQAATLIFNNFNGTTVTVQTNGAQPISFSFTALQTGQSPFIIISIVSASPGGSFSAVLGRGSCAGGCSSASVSFNCTNVNQNCTMYIPFCNLPNDYQTGTWTLVISNTGAADQFTAIAFAVNNNIGSFPLVSNVAFPFNIPPNGWANVAWNLAAPEICPVGICTQTSSIAFSSASASLLRFINDGTGLSCLAPFTLDNFLFSNCCSGPASRIYSFFNADFQNVATMTITPSLITQSNNHTVVVWPNGQPSVSSPFIAPPTSQSGATILSEYFVVMPGIPQFGNLIFQHNIPGSVTVYFQRNFLAGPTGHGGCFASEFSPTTPFTIFACSGSTNPLTLQSTDVYFPQGIWVGFENNQNVIQSGTFNFSFVGVINIVNNTPSQVVTSINTVTQQFRFVPSPNSAYIQRAFRFNVTVLTGTVTMYVNRRGPAGPAGGCLNNILAGAATSGPSSSILGPVQSCPFNPDIFFIGIVTSSSPTASYTVTATEINLLNDASTPAIVIQPFVSFFNNGPGSSTNYDFRLATVPANSYLRVTVNNITFGATYVITVYRDGSCQPFENTFCGETQNFGYKCTTVLGGCQLQDNVLYHLVIDGPGGATYSVLAEVITFGAGGLPIVAIPTPPGRPGETLIARLTTPSVVPHDLALYQVVLPPSQVLPGENVQLFIESFICGSVDAYGYVGGPPGPFCSTNDNICGPSGNPSPNCLVATLDQCDTFRASTAKANWATDLWVLVRGKAHSNGNIAIRYTFRVERSASFDVRHFYYLEKHQIFPVQPTPPASVTPAVCPASRVPAPVACCPATGSTSGSWIWQPTVFHFPVEGARFLNDFYWQRLKISIDNRLSPFISTARLRVWNQHPSFCPQDFPNRIQNPGEFTQCIVTQAVPNCTVNLQIPICGLVDSHLLFFTVDNIQFTPGALPLTVAGFKEGVTISHTRVPNVIIPIFCSGPQIQYFEDDLSVNEVQYFKVFHNSPGVNNYHFHVQLIRVQTGTIALNHHWSECPGNTVCVSTQCQDVDARFNLTNDCKVDPDCSCDYEQMLCRGGDMNSAPINEGFFTLKGLAVTGGFDVARYNIKVTCSEPLESITTVVCGNETCEDERYYNQVPVAGPEELYRFRLTSVNGRSNILIANDNVIGLDGYLSPVQGPSCQKTRLCDSLVDGRLEECVTFYRTVADGTPYVSILTTANCTDHRITRFNLVPDKHTPRIAVLTDGVRADSQVFSAQSGCSVGNQTYWYKITTTGRTYMVVELWSLQGETMQLWVTKNHISWHAFGENLPIGCVTGASGTQGNYCRYIIACSYTPGLYYIQVSDSSPLPKLHPYFRHQIRVSTMDPIDIPLTHLNDVSLQLVEDLRQIQTVTISNVNGQEVQPWQDLVVYTFSQTTHDSWMTRNRFGDASCSVSAYSGRFNFNNHSVVECQVDNSGGVFKVHFITNPANSCGNSRLASVSSRFNSPGTPVLQTNPVNTKVNMNIIAGQTIYVKHTLAAALGNNDIVVSSLTNYDTRTRLTTTLWKGNHLNTDRQTYGLPCSRGCLQGPREVSNNVAWGDICFHCGSGLYDTIFTKIDANIYTGNTSLINVIPFASTLTVLQPTPLSATPQNVVHAREEPSFKFFTMQYTRDRGSRVELVINKGGAIGVEINVYASCGLRTNPSQYWCFPGHFCSLPVPENHNFGDFYQNSGVTSPYIATTQLLVVRAIDATYTISQVTSIASCASITTALAPFCSLYPSVVSRPMWGNTNTFLQKDYNAREFYYNLTKAFSCQDGSDHCDCAFLSIPCLNNLAIYACLSHFNPCDTEGLELQPTNTDCLNVETTCFKTFRCAGYPERECGNSFYFKPAQPTRAPVGQNITPTAPVAPGQRPPVSPGAPLSPGQKPPVAPGSPGAPGVAPGSRPPTPPILATVPPGGIPRPTAPTPTTPTTPGNVQGAFPGWIPAVVIFLVVLVALLLVATIIGGVLLCTGAAHGPGEVDAYQAL